MIPLPELHARLQVIAGRVAVDHELAIHAVLGAAGLAVGSLGELSDEQYVQALEIARQWDAADSDAGDPSREQLEVAAAKWRRLRGAET